MSTESKKITITRVDDKFSVTFINKTNWPNLGIFTCLSVQESRLERAISSTEK